MRPKVDPVAVYGTEADVGVLVQLIFSRFVGSVVDKSTTACQTEEGLSGQIE